MNKTLKHLIASTALCFAAGSAAADIIHADDVIAQFSMCVGNDCVNGESFGFDTLRLKENNLRIHFSDTSTSASFPTNDWRIVINDTGNGGTNHFSVEDSTAGRSPFRIEAGAAANSLVVEADGDIGIGTLNPVVELHVVDGDSPTLRLEQNGSSGFTPQTFDLVSNEANFFIRDVTNGSQLPFRIKPGADTDALFIAADNDIGMGTDSPDADLEISTSETFTFFRLTALGANNDSADITYTGAGGAGQLRYNIVDGDAQEMSLDADGNMILTGTLTTTGATCGSGCDRVFDEDYPLLSIEDHASLMFENRHLPAVGPTQPFVPVNLTEKMGNMLNELEHAHIYIDQLHARLSVLEAQLVE